MSAKLLNVAGLLIIIFIVGLILIGGSNLLIPFIIAVFLWQFLNTIACYIKGIYGIGRHLPFWLCLLFALVVVIAGLYELGSVITNNVNEVIINAPRYQHNLKLMLGEIEKHFGIHALAKLNNLIDSVSFKTLLLNVYSVFRTFTSNALVIAFYVSFLFVEQQVMLLKLKALFPKSEHYQLARRIIAEIIKDTQTYVGIKSAMSLMTAVASWVVMMGVGLDFAAFWGILIFCLNFIPNIGSIIATAFPMLLALVQFQHSWWPFIMVTTGIIATQLVVGSLVEPRFLAKSLNLSPLVILVSLAIWGQLWGIVGMFLSVPIMVIIMIICSHFERTQPIAILLSQNGSIKGGAKLNCS